MARWTWKEVEENEQHTHWIAWARAIFTPMYGQRDRAGRLISLVARALVLLYKTFWSALWIAFHGVLFVSYGMFPIVSVAMVVATFV